MKKILGLGLAALLVMAMVGGGTWAYFNDVETATDNTITAGTLNLLVGAVDGTVTPFTLGGTPGFKPTDAGTAPVWDITNSGSLSGSLTVATSAITNDENTRSAIETTAGDASSGATTGELGGLLKIAIWLDTNKDGNLDVGENYLTSAGTVVPWAGTANTVFNIANVAAAYDIVNNYASLTWTSVATIAGSGDAGNFTVEYNFPHNAAMEGSTGLYTDNRAQSDDVKFTLTFTLQ